MPLRQLVPQDITIGAQRSSPYKVDIVAVHGLNPRSRAVQDHAFRTWTKGTGKKEHLWLRDTLPQTLPLSRVFLYEYESSLVFNYNRGRLIDKANDFLDALRSKRKDDPHRPIIFVAHSLGGILVKQALVNAHNNYEDYGSTKDATVGLMFFGTPHSGGNDWLVGLGQIAVRIAVKLGFSVKSDLVETMKEGNIFADILSESFRHQLLLYQIVSFWEERDNIVSKGSATFQLPGGRERVLGLNSTHQDMCRFDPAVQDDADSLEKVMSSLEDLYNLAMTRSRELWMDLASDHSNVVISPQKRVITAHTEKIQLAATHSNLDSVVNGLLSELGVSELPLLHESMQRFCNELGDLQYILSLLNIDEWLPDGPQAARTSLFLSMLGCMQECLLFLEKELNALQQNTQIHSVRTKHARRTRSISHRWEINARLLRTRREALLQTFGLSSHIYLPSSNLRLSLRAHSVTNLPSQGDLPLPNHLVQTTNLPRSRLVEDITENTTDYQRINKSVSYLERSTSLSKGEIDGSSMLIDSSSDKTVYIRAGAFANTKCLPGCPCQCHQPTLKRSMSHFNNIIGTLFYTFMGRPYAKASCDYHQCSQTTESKFKIIYFVPHWLWKGAIHVSFGQSSGSLLSGLRVTKRRQIPTNTDVFRYIRTGQSQELQKLLQQRRASAQDIGIATGQSVLTFAVSHLQIDACKVLLSFGADPLAPNVTALADSAADLAWNLAQEYCTPEAVRRQLWQLFPTPDLENRNFTHLHEAVLGIKQWNLEQLLSTSRNTIDQKDSSGRSVLHWAAFAGNHRVLSQILSCGAQPNLRDVPGRAALHFAAQNGSLECVRVLLNAGASVSPRDDYKETPLHLAASDGRNDVLLLLLERSAEIDARDSWDETPLDFAVLNNNAVGVRILLEHEAELDARDKHGYSILLNGVWANSHSALEVLLAAQPALDVVGSDGKTLLHVIGEFADLQTIEIFLALEIRGLNVEAKDSEGRTPRSLFEQRQAMGYADDTLAEAFRALLLGIRAHRDLASEPAARKRKQNVVTALRTKRKNAVKG